MCSSVCAFASKTLSPEMCFTASIAAGHVAYMKKAVKAFTLFAVRYENAKWFGCFGNCIVKEMIVVVVMDRLCG